MDPRQILSELIDVVVREGGSDLHISANHVPSIRVSGELIQMSNQDPIAPDGALAILSEMISDEQRARFLEKQELDFSYSTEQGARFRGNAFFQRGEVSIALRLIPAEIKTLEELNLPSSLERFARLEQGFFLCVGPVGHGKTTTLASLIDIINRERSVHIVTIEDPIEYIFQEQQAVIAQREVGMDTRGFDEALRSVFRQDIDTLMVGEMRGPKTVSTAVTAAETGHLVFSTLHTNNAAQTIDRIIDSFSPEQQGQIRAQLSQSLAGIFSQRLIPRISGGRIPAYELLLNNSAVSNLIREGRTHEINVVVETGSDEGMIDMNRTLADLVRRGEISPENAQLYSQNPRGLARMI